MKPPVSTSASMESKVHTIWAPQKEGVQVFRYSGPIAPWRALLNTRTPEHRFPLPGRAYRENDSHCGPDEVRREARDERRQAAVLADHEHRMIEHPIDKYDSDRHSEAHGLACAAPRGETERRSDEAEDETRERQRDLAVQVHLVRAGIRALAPLLTDVAAQLAEALAVGVRDVGAEHVVEALADRWRRRCRPHVP